MPEYIDHFMVTEWDDSEWFAMAFRDESGDVLLKYLEDGLTHKITEEHFKSLNPRYACSICGCTYSDPNSWECPGCGSV